MVHSHIPHRSAGKHTAVEPAPPPVQESHFRLTNPFDPNASALAGLESFATKESGHTARPHAGGVHRKTQSASVPRKPSQYDPTEMIWDEQEPVLYHQQQQPGLREVSLQQPVPYYPQTTAGFTFPQPQTQIQRPVIIPRPSAPPPRSQLPHSTATPQRPTPHQQMTADQIPLSSRIPQPTSPGSSYPSNLNFNQMHQMMTPSRQMIANQPLHEPEPPVAANAPPVLASAISKARQYSVHAPLQSAPRRHTRTLSARFEPDPIDPPVQASSPVSPPITAQQPGRPRARSCLRAAASPSVIAPSLVNPVLSTAGSSILPMATEVVLGDVRADIEVPRRKSAPPPTPGSLRTPTQMLQRLDILLGFGPEFLEEYLDLPAILDPARGYAIQQELPEKKGLKTVAKAVGVKKGTKEKGVCFDVLLRGIHIVRADPDPHLGRKLSESLSTKLHRLPSAKLSSDK